MDNKKYSNLRLFIVSEEMSEPIDEGIKKFSHYFARYLNKYSKNILLFSRGINKEFSNIEILPNNKLLLSIGLALKIRKYKPDIIIYLPQSSSTFLSFVRLKILQLYYRKAKTILISLQKRNHNETIQKMIKNIKPTKIVVFSKDEELYYTKLNIDCIHISSGVDVEQFVPLDIKEKTLVKNKYGFNEKDIVILHVGHINEKRNIHILKKLIPMGYKVIIVCSTSTEQDERYKENLKECGVLIFDKYLENIEKIYQLSDIYVFPVESSTSAIEFPLSILEAMSCNLPILTTRFGGIVDRFVESSSFKYFNNEEEMIKGIKLIKENKECNSREMIMKDYSWDIVFKNLVNNIVLK